MWNDNMSSTSADPTQHDPLQERLDMHRRRIQDPSKAFQVYHQILTDEERERVGPLEDAYLRYGQTVGIWMQAKGVSRNRAIIDIAKKFGLPDVDYDFLLRQIGEAPVPESHNSRLPVWKRDVSELWFDGELIKKIRRPTQARNQIPVLTAFQELGWPSRIDSPLSKTCRLGDVVRFLNKKRPKVRLERIQFERDGTGEGIRWIEIQAANHSQESPSV